MMTEVKKRLPNTQHKIEGVQFPVVGPRGKGHYLLLAWLCQAHRVLPRSLKESLSFCGTKNQEPAQVPVMGT